MHAKVRATSRMAMANRASHGPREGKNNSKESTGYSKGTKSANQGAKGFFKGKTSKTGLSGLENSKSEARSDTQESAQTCPTDTSWNDGWNGDEWYDGWSSVGWHEECEKRITHL